MARLLNPELQEKAVNELNEHPSQTDEDLNHMREWLRHQQHLNARTDDQWLMGFLRGCKFSLHKTKEKLDFFYTMRTLVPEFFAYRDPMVKESQDILKAGVFLPLPKTIGPVGARILLMRYSQTNPEIMTIENLTKVYFMIHDILIQDDDNFIVSGLYAVVDFKNFPPKYLLQFTPSLTKKALMCAQMAYPIRFKGVYLINAPIAFEAIFNMIKGFCNEKLNLRIKMISQKNIHTIYEDIPKEFLPLEFGSGNENFHELTELWKTKIESYREWFLEDAKYRSNENLRFGMPKTSADMFGVEGSFRKLNID